ncbi:hypothetical protein EGT74_11150 [Chitinophaga lutea]|uniref:Dual-action HEIGH metallo-peptidase n=1 Tax=Chitinophaga lutea TaxID=2488634 RepID=A0A3N4Q1R5_9BACT|nr:M57 family metalloprotease [Chitinophaga lutea]RPE14036.1 hypothetical protein EGT74_11150 [Chitinophaga lutea]
MKTMNRPIALLVCIVTLMAACKKQDVPSKPETATGTDDGLVLQKLKSYGIPEARIKDAGQYYAVDGDMYFHKKNADIGLMDRYFSKPKTDEATVLGRMGDIAQAHTNNVVSSANVEAVAIHIIRQDQSSAGVDWTWYDAILDAARYWNEVAGTKINIVNYGAFAVDANVSITFMNDAAEPLPYYVIAAAEWPTVTGTPGYRIRINREFQPNPSNPGQQVTYASKVYNMVHELGHCLGLRHADWENEGAGSIGANHIPGTPWNDFNSVMRSGTANNNWAGFSAGDVTAVQYLYPWSNPMDKWITSPDAKAPNNIVHLVEDDQTLTVTWNTSLHTTSGVTIKLYQHGVYKGTLGTGLPNTGSATFSRLQVYQALNFPNLYTEGNIRIELVSDANPAVKDITGFYVFRLNS